MVLSSDLIAFAVALMGSLLLTVPVRRLALHFGMVDLPGPRKVHLSPIPLLGGIAIYFGFVLAILFTLRGAPRVQIAGILAGATLLAAVGLLDDGKLLHHQVKLFIGMPIAAIILIASGVRAQIFSELVPGAAGLALDIGLTLVWVVGITASFSILDHMDGLCAGIAAVAAGFFTLSATLNGQTMVRTLAAAALGAALGFLIWNFNPAKIFMGDGGAMFLGFLMATLGLKIRPEGVAHFPAAWLVPVLILGATIFDTTLVSISRSRRGLIPFTTPGKDHAAHRLSNLGLGHRGAVIVLYCLGGILGGLAVLVPTIPPAAAYALAGVLAVAGLIAVALLERAPYERQVKHRGVESQRGS
jgi:UDP-GlcNAc:undecaprenyl-phosphate/decaprenyl-phosphate GlcNAc-1-phosphate transferase